MADTVSSLFSLSGRTAIVTGGTRGIGQAMAFALAEAGADIILVQRDSSNTATKDEIVNRIGRKAHIHVAELSDRKSIKEIIPAVTSQGLKPDILVNCAGIQRRHPSEKFPDEDWDEVSVHKAPNDIANIQLTSDSHARFLRSTSPPSLFSAANLVPTCWLVTPPSSHLTTEATSSTSLRSSLSRVASRSPPTRPPRVASAS